MHYRLGRFQEAAAAYAKAYEYQPKPAFLFNIAQCHRSLGQWGRAIHYYESFMREEVDPREAALATSLLRECRRQLRAERRGRSKRAVRRARRGGEVGDLADAQDAARGPVVDVDAVESHGLSRPTPAAVDPPTAPGPQETGGSSLAVAETAGGRGEEIPVFRQWWFWGLIGGGGLVAGVAAIALIAGGALEPAAETKPPSGSLGVIDSRGP